MTGCIALRSLGVWDFRLTLDCEIAALSASEIADNDDSICCSPDDRFSYARYIFENKVSPPVEGISFAYNIAPIVGDGR